MEKFPTDLSFEEAQQELQVQAELLKVLKSDQRAKFNPSLPQLEFLQSTEQEVALAGGNGQGKSWALLYLCSTLATGEYPVWWEGITFDGPIIGMIGGKTLKTTRDILLNRLLGPPGARGTGLIPADRFHPKEDVAPSGAGRGMVDWFSVKQKIPRSKVNDTWEYVKSMWHVFSFDSEVERIMGYFPNVVLPDEEPKSYEFYDQTRARLIHKDGYYRNSFTPEDGRTQYFDEFDRGVSGRKLVRLTIDSTEHWSEEKKEKERKRFEHSPNAVARLYGIPVEGRGVIYTIPDDELRGELPIIPGDYPRIIGVDLPHTGGTSACSSWAFDPETQRCYLIGSWKKQGATITEFCSVIRGMGGQVIPVAWPHDGGRKYGFATIAKTMKDEGLNMLHEASHTLDGAGNKVISTLAIIEVISELMSLGLMKWLPGNEEIFREKQQYRQKDGKPIPNQEDHLLHSMHTAITMRRFAKVVDLRTTGWQHKAKRQRKSGSDLALILGSDPYGDI